MMELIRAYVGQLALGKSDFDAISNVRKEWIFQCSLGIVRMPSSARLRQRFDEEAREIIPWVDKACVDLIRQTGAPIRALSSGRVALDMDGFPMDNSRTKKEGRSRTYKGYDGYVPMAAYLGREGWNIGIELREGKWHGQKEFGYVLERVLPRARQLVGAEGKLLLRLDSGHDAQENRERLIQEAQVDFLIKWNPRQQKPEEWLRRAEKPVLETEESTWRVEWSHPREGKRVALFSQRVEEYYTRGPRKGESYTIRRVVRITERHIDKKGQLLLIPEITLEGWWTTLDEQSHANQRMIELYKDHGEPRKTSTGWGFGGREHERLYRKPLIYNPSLNRQRPVGYLEKPAELVFRGTPCHIGTIP